MTDILWLDKVMPTDDSSDEEDEEEVSIESMTEEWGDFYDLYLKPCLENDSLFIKHQDEIRQEWASLKSKQIRLMSCPLAMPLARELLRRYRRCADSLTLLKHT